MKPSLSVHFIDCGQGNMTLLVTPREVVVYDCHLTQENSDQILNHLQLYVPIRKLDDEKQRWIDWFICSHRDKDHIHGLQTLHKHFPIRGIVDPGTISGSVDDDQNQYYMRLRRYLREKYGDEAVLEPEPSTTPVFNFGGVRFYCLCSGVDDNASDDGHYGNNIFQVEYANNRILLTGDSDWRAWKDKVVPTFSKSGLLKTTVLLASHHGSRTFFVDSAPNLDEQEAWEKAYHEHLALIAPTMTVISCGNQTQHNHPNETALKKYKEGTKYQQVYLTRNKGTLVGQFRDDGSWTVTPARFLHGWKLDNHCPTGKELYVRCCVYREGHFIREIESGERLSVGHELKFEVRTRGGLIGDVTKAKYTFEVSNGGAARDSEHDEIYSKGSHEQGAPNKFNRDLSYIGTHLLRCAVRNGKNKAQKVFVVHGTENQ